MLTGMAFYVLAGAGMDPDQKLWRVRWGLIRGDMELMERVVKG
jgi:hypothetical protein